MSALWPGLNSARLELRDFAASDFEAVHAYATDPLVVRYTSFGPNSEAQTRAFLAACASEAAEQPRRSYNLAVIERGSGRLIGSGALVRSDARQFALGYCFSRGAWQQGFGRETARVLVDWAFAALDAHRVWALVFKDNRPSARILEGLGFRQEGLAREALFARDAWHDVYTYAKLKSE